MKTNLRRRCTALTALALLAVAGMMTADAEPGSEKMEKGTLRHVVMFKFKDSSSDSDVQSVVDAFRALPKRIPEIADFEYGTNNSPEGLNEGLTHCFLVSFKSEEDREKYLPHPAHKEFVGVLKPHLDKVVVIDYWADK
ncbi:Stress responsive A/B Barrel Domain protein [Crateriforma conspicua]|uniref:Stress responsive A/B Barrel Domain protein n=2 Tax=Crateriforma conspicua TaxID=2527996 RepID=A0A5C5Y3V7_9PLAN|nr:Dabb family protein [Crateriforma conspicua]TWT68122.1 Stress responsive A/B Barrel Domain protein [Crateriforma conspicua]